MTEPRTASGDQWPVLPLIAAVFSGAGVALLFLMLFAPTAYRPLKAVLLGAVLFASVARPLMTGRLGLHPAVVGGTLLFSCVGLLFVIRGYLGSAPGALRMSTVFVAWPWVYMLLVSNLASQARVCLVMRVLIWTSIAVCVYCLGYIAHEAGWLSPALYVELDLGQAIGFSTGTIEVGLTSFSTLLFTVPFVTAVLLGWHERRPVGTATLWSALLLGLLVALLSGRRALQLVVVLGLPIAGMLRVFLPAALRRRHWRDVRKSLLAAMAAGTVVAALLLAGGLRPDATWATFKSGFEFSSDPVARSRAEQFDALIEGWHASRWFGSGHGASAPGVIRAPEMPWAYELSYLALLFHTGVLGVCIYAAGVGWMYVSAIGVIRRGGDLAGPMLATLTGTTAFLIANATNPYLEKFDSLWVIFLPLGLVNLHLLRDSRAARSRDADA